MTIIQITASPPFPWVGGKTALLPYILDRLPDDCDRYVEVFGGSGAVLFARQPASFEIYNDYNGHLTNLMWQIKNRQEEFLDLVLRPVINTDDEHARLQLERLFVSARDEFLINNMLYMAGDDPEALFSRIKKLVLLTQNTQRDMRHTLSLLDKILYQAKRRAQDPDLWDAVITYEVIKLSYGNSCDTWCCKQVGVTGVEKIIKNAARRLEHVGIENKDFRQLIPLYDRPNALMYLDPPYYKAEDFYLHAGQFNEQSHRDLHDLALHMGGRCLLSYNGCDFIRELYSESKFYKYEFTRPNNLKLRYDAGSQFSEILIANYNMDEVIANKREQLTLF